MCFEYLTSAEQYEASLGIFMQLAIESAIHLLKSTATIGGISRKKKSTKDELPRASSRRFLSAFKPSATGLSVDFRRFLSAFKPSATGLSVDLRRKGKESDSEDFGSRKWSSSNPTSNSIDNRGGRVRLRH
ncbi:hypothetical protein RJ641_014204 [Dillenia turbinata]|uniref:Uncharacterized protein n=1 Tax=Dillenia turbinata TaxID=194707 RepID=A0AAN8UYW5_9MAGN